MQKRLRRNTTINKSRPRRTGNNNVRHALTGLRLGEISASPAQSDWERTLTGTCPPAR
jgi:hypothetical protein